MQVQTTNEVCSECVGTFKFREPVTDDLLASALKDMVWELDLGGLPKSSPTVEFARCLLAHRGHGEGWAA